MNNKKKIIKRHTKIFGAIIAQYDKHTKEWYMTLPHECGEWVIGNVKESKEFIDDLNLAIKYCKLHK